MATGLLCLRQLSVTHRSPVPSPAAAYRVCPPLRCNTRRSATCAAVAQLSITKRARRNAPRWRTRAGALLPDQAR